MKNALASAALLGASALALLTLGACRTTPDYSRALPVGAPALIPLPPGAPHPDFAAQWRDRDEIVPALDHSIEWTKRESAQKFFPVEGISHARALKSLTRFRELLTGAHDEAEFRDALEREFQVYESAGWNGKGGGVLFTGYCTPILKGALARDAQHTWPLYGLPPDLVKAPTGEILGRRTANGLEPYPSRRAIEAGALLEGKGLELVWLADPLDAYIAHVNGSAFVELPDGALIKLGYSGKNGQPYTSLGQELVKDKQLRKDEVSLTAIRRWAREHPAELDDYLARNASYVFFARIDHDPHGSLNVPVTAWRSLATDKTLFPRGALVFVETKPHSSTNYGPELSHFMFDQDTGGAIRTAGRADVYLGVGPDAEHLAGTTRSEGQLYYLFVRGE
jgi:membrane-bound lytic murein transglycosylase A